MRNFLTPLFRSAVALLLLAPVALAAATDPKTVSLQPNFTPKYEAKLIMETSRTSTRLLSLGNTGSKPQESVTSGQQTIEFLMQVVRNDEKGSAITLRVDRIEMTAKTIQGEFAWKSTDPRTPGDNANPVLSTMRPALGAMMTLEFDPQGNLTRADNGGVQMPTGEIVDFIRLVVGQGELRTRWSPTFCPRKGDFTVKLGEKWKGEEKLASPPLGVFTESREYVLSSLSDRLAVIDFTGKFELSSGIEGQEAMFKVKDSAIAGNVHWDRSMGFFESMELTQRIELQGSAQGIPIGYRTETTVKVRREEKSAQKPG